MAAYETFIQWKTNKKASSFSENVFLAYFNELANRFKPSSLWCIYSMLKTTVKNKNNIDIKNYSNLTAFLKRRSDGYVARKSKVLSPTDVEKFLKEAPDYQYLATKVAMIFGVTGACRRQELSEVTAKDVETHGQMLLIKINNTKNKVPRSFAIHGPFYDIVKKYEALRTDKAKSDRFFQNYQKGRCVAQPIDINKFGAMPKEIAKFLNLPDPDLYTGHSFRRTSATLLADSGADLLTLKRHGGWRSSTVAESYVEDSVRNKSNICTQITHAINLEPQVKKMCPEPQPSTSRDTSYLLPRLSISESLNEPPPLSSIFVHNEPVSPTFTQEDNNEIVTNNITQTVQMPNKTARMKAQQEAQQQVLLRHRSHIRLHP
ncbi:uncharacterized protein LOC113231544 [Hyposmocoma kahamanoa]|uniref:uncharacterized protein LOC113231544 n=1 Tax=Hyposmocoma kahamanoa TaxID=1477025 RepID=UPI000E6D9F60|nr:uncharacterized protein LOC113231544 [Hyposmocoma kahamanoa]